MRTLRILTLLLLLSSVVMAQTRLISGTITDSKTGNPLPSVTIKVKGKNIQAVSADDGSISVKQLLCLTTTFHLYFHVYIV